MAEATAGACASPGCSTIVEQRLACPKCLQLGIPPAYFCSQQCFKDNWATHKRVHSLYKQILLRAAQKGDGVSCPIDAPVAVQRTLPQWATNYSFTGPLRPCLMSPRRTVPEFIRRPDYADHSDGVSESEQRDKWTNNNRIRVYSRDEIENGEYGLRHACQMGRQVLDEAGKALRPGVTTDELDRIVHEACMERECYPSPLNYYNFPKSVCISVNEAICHGIPDYRELQDGGMFFYFFYAIYLIEFLFV
jgi:methionyl aminopeptidase